MAVFKICFYINYVETQKRTSVSRFRVKEKIKNYLQKILCTLFGGEKCISCGTQTVNVPICRNCLDKMLGNVDFVNRKRCSCCGRLLLSENESCMACREEKLLVHSDGVYPVFSYRLWHKKLLFAWKIQEKRSLSPVFAEIIDKAIKNIPGLEKPVIVPVPPRPGKIWKKGWDQIEELCSYLKAFYGYEIMCLLKRNSGEQQKKLDRMQRLGMKDRNYSLLPEKKLKKLKIPEKVLLIDDVLTTGVTTESCCTLLKEAGCRNVKVITLFIVD